MVRISHKNKVCVWAENQKGGGKMAQSLLNTKENKNKSREHLLTHSMEGEGWGGRGRKVASEERSGPRKGERRSNALAS